MEGFKEYLIELENNSHKDRLVEVLEWVINTFPEMKTRVAWKQAMFTDHGTFIIAFGHSKKHMSIAPEHVTINCYKNDIVSSGYEYSKELIKIKWTDEVDYSLIKKIINYNINEKKMCDSFWRK